MSRTIHLSQNSILFAFLSCLFLFQACTSSQKLLERGDYIRATATSLDRLCSRPNDEEAANVLRQSYPLALQQLEAQIQSNRGAVASASMQVAYWDALIDSYRSVNNYDQRIRSCPAAFAVINNPRSYQAEALEAMRRASQIHCQLGSEKLAMNRRELAAEAFNHFQKTQTYAPEMCPDALVKMEKARLMGLLKVLVEQMPVQGVYAPSDEFFRNQINTYLLTLRKANQLDFFYDPLAMQMPPNYKMRFQFYDFTVGETYNRERVEVVTDTVRFTQQQTSTEQKSVGYEIVRAELRIFEKSVRSNSILEIKILDEDNQRVLMHDRVPSEDVWTSNWASYQGDKRALSAEQLALCAQREQQTPDRQTLFTKMCEPLLVQIKPKLQEFYKDKR
jgi:hypothetical protein